MASFAELPRETLQIIFRHVGDQWRVCRDLAPLGLNPAIAALDMYPDYTQEVVLGLCANGNLGAAKEIVKRYTDPQPVGQAVYKCLSTVLRMRRVDIADWLITHYKIAGNVDGLFRSTFGDAVMAPVYVTGPKEEVIRYKDFLSTRGIQYSISSDGKVLKEVCARRDISLDYVKFVDSDIPTTDVTGALAAACRMNRLDIVEYLCTKEKNWSLPHRQKDKDKVLYEAVRSGIFRIVEIVCDKVDITTISDRTKIADAAIRSTLDIAKLIQARFKIEYKDVCGSIWYVFDTMCTRSDKLETVKWLTTTFHLHYESMQQPHKRLVKLSSACKSGKLEIVKYVYNNYYVTHDFKEEECIKVCMQKENKMELLRFLASKFTFRFDDVLACIRPWNTFEESEAVFEALNIKLDTTRTKKLRLKTGKE